MFCLAAATLGFELAYNKIVVVQNYGNLGYVVIGTALFGFALSGVLLTCHKRLQAVPSEKLVPLTTLLASLSMVAAYAITSAVPLDFTAFFRQPAGTLGGLAAWYLALTLPFFFAGLAICSLLSRGEQGVGWLYGADLLGAGTGSILTIQAMAWLGGAGTVWASAILTAISAAVFAGSLHRKILGTAAVSTLALAVSGPLVVPRLGVVVHTPKRGFVEDRDAGRILHTQWSAISRIDVAEHGDHRMIWFDAGSMQSHMFPFGGDFNQLPDALPKVSSGILPYLLAPRRHALVIASSGGKELLWALSNGAQRITAVELDPVVCRLVSRKFNDYLGGLFRDPRVQLINEEGRSFIKRSPNKYDVIEQVSAYSVTMVTTGAAATSDSYLLTVEAICDYFNHLTDSGVLFIARENGFKLLATVLAALERLGIDPAGRIYLERGVNAYNYNALMLRKTPFPKEELTVIAQELRARPRAVFIAPEGLREQLGADWESDRNEPIAIQTYERIYNTKGLERQAYLASLPFVAVSATDDKPFANRTMPFLRKIDARNPALPEEIKQMAEDARKFGPIPIGDIPALAVLAEAVLLAGVFIFFPLRRLERTGGRGTRGTRWMFLFYFSLLGVGFIALEVILLQRFILFVGSPTHAMSIVLGSLLVFAGLGSMTLSPLAARGSNWPLGIFVLIGVIAFLYATRLEAVFDAWLKYELATRCLLSVALLAPLGLLLGVPFPTGLRLAGRLDSRLVAWGWALNGYMTVVGTTAISIIIQFLGYRWMLLMGGVIYLIAGACLVWLIRRSPPQEELVGVTVASRETQAASAS